MCLGTGNPLNVLGGLILFVLVPVLLYIWAILYNSGRGCFLGIHRWARTGRLPEIWIGKGTSHREVLRIEEMCDDCGKIRLVAPALDW